jgi:hypothetical protein
MAGDHFYTISVPERDNAFAFLDYLEEGTACYVYAAPASNTTPLYRCLNLASGDHFYTISSAERDSAINAYGYRDEGIACHVFAAAQPGTVPLLRLLNKANGDHFYTTSQSEANSAVYAFGYQAEGIACHVFADAAVGTTPLFRLVQVSDPNAMNASQSPWAVLLCKFKGDTFEPPAAAGVPAFRTVCERFFTQANTTFNAVKYFSDMSHGKLDLTGSQVLGWYEIDASITGRNAAGDPIIDKSQNEVIALARQAAKDAGVAVDKFAGIVVIMNQATGWAQGSPGSAAMDWRRVDGRNFDGTLGARAPGGGNGTEAFAQEMGHGYGLDHSRMQGSNTDYQDQWDSMSTLSNTFRVGDPDYGARAPGLNAWNMRSRGWLDESRIWKPPSGNADFSATVQLRPLHQRNLPGFLGAEIPGIGADSPYLVEFRIPELWDAGAPNAVVLVHRFSGAEENGQSYSPGLLGQGLHTHSYIMSATNGQFGMTDGDIFESGSGPFARMKVLSIDRANRVATVQLCYSQLPAARPKVKIKVDSSADSCTPALIEGAIARFRFTIDGIKCAQSYTISWSVTGASAVVGEPGDQQTYSVTLPDPNASVTVSVKLTLDDGSVVADSFQFNSLSSAEASLREFLCKLLRERLKPIPWWEWDPARLRTINSRYSRAELAQVVRALEAALQRLKSL